MTLKEIANEVGVSISTVSRVINTRTPHAASPEVQQAIWECVRKNGYIPSKKSCKSNANLATNNENSSARVIACIFARNNMSIGDNFYFTGIAKCFEKTSLELHYSTQNYFTAMELNERNLGAMANLHLDGAIVIGRHDKALIDRLHSVVKHVVYTGLAHPAGDDYDAVICDRYQIGATVAEYLLSLNHRKIGYIGETEQEISYEGFKDTLKSSGYDIDGKFIINVLASMENGYKGMMKLLEEKDRPTAVFCMNDHVAIGALRALHECGVNCPGEISLIGIDNIEASNYTTPKLTTIHTPMQELGSISAKVLVDRIEGGHTISLKVFLPFSIVERESCRAL